MYPKFNYKKRLLRFSGDAVARAFFGGNALVSLIVLGLITIFLFKEGIGFFGQNRENLSACRISGQEYVDILRDEETTHAALVLEISDIRLNAFLFFTEKEKLSPAETGKRLAAFDAFAEKFGNAGDKLRDIVATLEESASETKAALCAGGHDGKTTSSPDALAAKLKPLRDALPQIRETNKTLAGTLTAALAALPELPTPALTKRSEKLKTATQKHIAGFPEIENRLAAWNAEKPISPGAGITSFLFGREWLTASFWEDRYGILPLLAGSLLVAAIALVIAVPSGVAAAVYTSQIATPREQRIIKPAIEFIAMIPSVVLGFFGIAVLGEFLKNISGSPFLSGFPGFPIVERLNALNAGCLLAFISIPMIFTIAEDALNNVPRALREASYAVGASRVQTIVKVVIPAALSGIMSATLLGLGRVLGETMIVLLCAGNRIAIPEFSSGAGVVTQPVHTMTGIIAQEMGEVVRGGIHYRALFAVGIVLFMLSLSINFGAQKIVARYRLPAS